jgi:hypothetical protein
VAILRKSSNSKETPAAIALPLLMLTGAFSFKVKAILVRISWQSFK